MKGPAGMKEGEGVRAEIGSGEAELQSRSKAEGEPPLPNNNRHLTGRGETPHKAALDTGRVDLAGPGGQEWNSA